MESIRVRAEEALARSWRRIKGDEVFRADYPRYVRSLQDNLVEGVHLDSFVSDLERGAGSELKSDGKHPPKFCAAFSSSALTVNSFAPFKTAPQSLNLGQAGGFSSADFEYPCPSGLPGTPPHLDFLAKAPPIVVGIESKCTEFLTPKEAFFASSYDRVKDCLEPAWRSVYGLLKKKPGYYAHLGADQLVKHYLGLQATFPTSKKVLIYLYWEPVDAKDFEVFSMHRKEVAEFSDRVQRCEVDFQARSYLELWHEWSNGSNRKVSTHAKKLMERYTLNLA